MCEEDMDQILSQIGKEENMTKQQVRKEMEGAIEEEQNSANSTAQALWNAIPRKGPKLTLEEFLEYMIYSQSS